MSHRHQPGQQRRARILIAATAVSVLLLAGVLANASSQRPHYAYQRVDGLVCVVERGSETIVARDDGTLECVTSAAPAVQVADRSGS